MGTIVERRRRNGTTGYHAQVTVQKAGRVHRETKTFDRRPAANAWIKKREDELSKPGALETAAREDPTLGEVIDRYLADSRKAVGRTKAQVLRSIKAHDLANQRCSAISSTDIVAYAQGRAAQVSPATVSNDLSHLQAVFAIARPAWGYPLDATAMADAFKVTRRLGLTGKSKSRDRRPTLPELDRLIAHFGERQLRRPGSAPMQRIIAFAIFSTRRQEEITRIAWDDLDEQGSRILVRDMKNPGETVGNDSWCDLPPEALRILLAMPKVSAEIFPYSAGAIGAAFTRACPLLDIVDLRFHDLRHDGVSRLFEMGASIPRAAAVSGHRSWSSLKRYTHLRQTGDKYAGWPWLDRIALPSPDASRPQPTTSL